MRKLSSFVLALTGACGLGCLNNAPIPEAPEDVDGLFHWLWVNYEVASDAELHDAARKLAAKTAGIEVGTADRGGLTDLSASELKPVGLDASRDPTRGRGFFLNSVFPCTLAKVEQITYALDQDALYKDMYDRYHREYTSDFQAYVERRVNTLTWRTELDSKILTAAYTEELLGGVRYVAPSDERSIGPLLLARTHMPAPARFKGDDTTYDQDYQIELYYERSPGELAHAYGIWREVHLKSLNLSSEDNGMVNIFLNAFVEWDLKKTAKLCAE